MTRVSLEKYHDIVVRLKELKTTIVTDSVKGSSDEYPYTSHSITLHGVRLQDCKRLLRDGTVRGGTADHRDVNHTILSWYAPAPSFFCRYRPVERLI